MVNTDQCILSQHSFQSDNELMTNFKKNIEKGNFNSLISNKIEEEIILYNGNNIYQISPTYIQNKNEYYNRSTIYLGECENKIRNHYNISRNISLLIFKIDGFVEVYKYLKYNMKYIIIKLKKI